MQFSLLWFCRAAHNHTFVSELLYDVQVHFSPASILRLKVRCQNVFSLNREKILKSPRHICAPWRYDADDMQR